MKTALRIFSIGIVAENKSITTNTIKVTPIEIIPLIDGDVAANPKKVFTSGLNAQGIEYTSKVTSDITLDAEWFSLSTNRRTSPDVMRGEQVLIWQYGDTDRYFWTSMGRDDELRRLETVIYAWSDEADPDRDIELGVDNTYNFELSTHKKHITFQTCKNNGERFKYTLQVDTENSKVTLTDDAENRILLDSANTLIELNNSDGTNYQMDRKNIHVFAPDSIDVTAKNTISFQCTDFILKADASIDITTKVKTVTCLNYDITATAKMTLSTALYAVTSPMSTFTGMVMVGGGLAVGGGGGSGPPGGITSVGDISTEGGMECTGDAIVGKALSVTGAIQSASLATGPITCSGITSTGAVNAPNIP